MSNIETLAVKAETIRDEKGEGANTAERVGGLLTEIVEELGTTQTTVKNIYNKIYNEGDTTSSVSWKYEDVPENINPAMADAAAVGYLTINGDTAIVKAPTSSSFDPTNPTNVTNITNIIEDAVQWEQLYRPNTSEREHIANIKIGDGLFSVYAPKGGSDSSGSSVTWTQEYDPNGSKVAAGQSVLIASTSGFSGSSSGLIYAPKTKVEVTQDYTGNSATRQQIATIAVDGVPTRIYAPKASSVTPPSSGGVAQEDFEDAIGAIDTRIQELEDEMRGDFEAIINGEDEDMNAWVQGLIDGYNFIDGHSSGWNDQLNKYLQNVGLVELNQDGTVKTKKWSYIEQGVGYINEAVNKINYLSANDYEALGTLISQKIVNDEAIIDLRARYATGSTLDGILRWMSSGITLESNDKKTFAELWSAAKDTATNTEAIAGLKTKVDYIDGQYVATTELGTLVKSELGWTQAGIEANGTLDSALADLFAKNSSGARASIATVAEGKVSTIIMSADFISAVASQVNISASVIKTMSQDLVIEMDKLMLGDNSNFYMHTLNQGNSNLGFEMVCAAGLTVDQNGNYTEDSNNPYNKITMHYDYTAMTKLSCDHIIMSNGNQGSGGSTSDFQVEKGMAFRWFDTVNTAAGDIYSFNSELGSIVFDGEGIKITMLQGKKIKLNGTVLHEV